MKLSKKLGALERSYFGPRGLFEIADRLKVHENESFTSKKKIAIKFVKIVYFDHFSLVHPSQFSLLICCRSILYKFGVDILAKLKIYFERREVARRRARNPEIFSKQRIYWKIQSFLNLQ